MKSFYLSIILLLFLISCKNNKNKNDVILDRIESLLNIYPDSAYFMLDSINLKPNEHHAQNRYFLYRIISKDRSNQDIYMDKEIIAVYDYFKNKKEPRLTYLSAFYCGRVLQENKEYDLAIPYYNTAETLARIYGDKDFQGNVLYTLGRLMVEQFQIDDAKAILTQANSLFKETSNHKYEIKSYKLLGFYYLMTEDIDSSYIFYNQALDLSIKYNDKEEHALTSLNLGVIHNEQGDYNSAIRILKQAILIDSVVCKSGKVFMNLAESYLALSLTDSARYYAEYSIKAINNNNQTDANANASAYMIYSAIEEKSDNYKEALRLHKIYCENLANVLSQTKDNAMIDAQKKYKYEAVHNENNSLSVKHLKTQRFLILSLLFIALLIIVYNRKLILKNKQLIKANNEIIQLTENLKDNDKQHSLTKDSYRDHVLHNFNVLKRAASLEYHVQDTGNKQGKALIRSFNTVAYGNEKIDWDILYNVINSMYNGFFDQIKKKYTTLDENEFRICSLIYSKFNSNEIAVVTGLSINTVHMKTTYIRKKLGIEKYGNIIDYFNDNLNISNSNLI